MIEPGRVCLKIAGREAGLYCVIVERIDDNFVLITGPKTVTGVKRRRCNINHIEPTEHKLEIDSKADDAFIEDIWKKSGLIEKLGIKIPVKKAKLENAETKKQ
ncbi:MAG: 50S ribosomal protein L14e [Candidatus Aenigmatarchaeota archaeon]